ncbi:hypothetical protein Tco_1387407, partial [Tanacetum coccineum]
FSVKDYQTHRLLFRCDSTVYLYSVTQQPPIHPSFALLSLSSTTWHRRLSHSGEDMLRRKHVKLHFNSSESTVTFVFEIIHSDLWTSPVLSESGIKCLDMSTNKIIISWHVRFDKDVFPFRTKRPSTPPNYDFILPIAASQPMAAPPPT